MKLTVDILDDFIALLTLTGVINSFSDDSTNTTLNVDATFHVRAGMFITVDGNSHKVFSVNVDSQIVVVGVIINPVLFAVAPPFYFHGTPIATNQEISGAESIDKLPMIYLAESLKEKDLDENSAIARESEVRLFFLDTANFEDWETDDYYSDRLSGLNSLIDQFILSYKKFKLFESFDTVFSRVNFAKWGVFSNNRGTLTNIFDDNLTGVELSFTLKLRKCDAKTTFSVCSAKTSDELVNILGRGYNYTPPTGQTVVYRTGDDADIEATVFAPIRAANSLKIQNGLMADFITLTNNNAFGNLKRLTNNLGGLVFDGIDGSLIQYLVDNYTGFGWGRIVINAASWDDQIDGALASTLNGLSGWFVPNKLQLQSVANVSNTAFFTDVGFSKTSGNFITSTTTSNFSTAAFRMTTATSLSGTAKTNLVETYLCRRHIF